MRGKPVYISFLRHAPKMLLLGLFTFGLLALPSFAQAQETTGVLDALKNLPITLPLSLFALLAFVAVIVFTLTLGLAQAFLQSIISPNFTQLSYTNVNATQGTPAWNPLVEAGLQTTESLANMVLVLVLVYIAVATILRLSEYGTKKLLVTFVIVALLINFAPVLLGLLIDASNIAMNFFLQRTLAPASAIKVFIARAWTTELGSFWEVLTNKNIAVNRTAQLSVAAVLAFVATVIYMLFGILFLLRYMMLWILVILAPLAFATFIIPGTRRLVWNMWWGQVVQWTLIGFAGAFFLYLAETLIGALEGTLTFAGENLQQSTGGAGIVANLGTQALLPLSAIIFLILTFYAALATSAIGTKSITNMTQGLVRGTARKGLRTAGKFAASPYTIPAKKAAQWAEPGVRSAAGFVSEAWGSVPVMRWARPKALAKFSQHRPALQKAITAAKEFSSRDNSQDALSGTAKGMEATGKILESIQRGDSQDIFNEGKKIFGAKTDEELLHNVKFRKKMNRLLRPAMKAGMLSSDVLRREPRLAALLPRMSIADQRNMPVELRRQKETEAVSKAVGEARPSHTLSWEKQTLEPQAIVEKLMERPDRAMFEAIAQNVKEGPSTLQEGMDTGFSEFIDKAEAGKISNVRGNDILRLKSAQRGDEPALELARDLYKKDYTKRHGGQAGLFKNLRSEEFRERSGLRELEYLSENNRAEIQKGREVKLGPWASFKQRRGVPIGPTIGHRLGIRIGQLKERKRKRKEVEEEKSGEDKPTPSSRDVEEEKSGEDE